MQKSIQKYATRFLLALAVCMVLVPSVHAMTRDELNAEISRLTVIAEALVAQIRALGALPTSITNALNGGSGSTPGGTPRFDAGSICTQITTTLKQGTTSPQVVSLQDALASIGVFNGSSTGYFGPLTAEAVRRFQNANGIYATDSVDTATSTALYRACTGGASYLGLTNTAGSGAGTGSGNVVAAVDRSSLSVTPTSGRAPVSVTALFAINGTTCSSYSLDWGDSTTPVSRTGSTDGCATDNINRQLAHTYMVPGTYTITLRTIRGAIASAPVVAQSVVTVQ